MPTITLILFFLGFYILIKSANLLVAGASSIARFFNISQWVIGIIIVGIGTSIPELSINLAAIFNGTNVGIGTIIGSNTFNILVILGLSAIISPLIIKREWTSRDFIFNILAIIMAAVMIYLPVLGNQSFGGITRLEGLALFILFIFWATYVGTRRGESAKKVDYKMLAFSTSFLMVTAGIIGVFLGGRWIVDGAQEIARALGVSEYLIGLTIVGIGTSAPELTVSLIAALKKNAGIAVGNIIGSNIFDFLGILGVAALFRPIAVMDNLEIDILVTLAAALLLFFLVFAGRKNVLKRWEGELMVFLYTIYFLSIVWR